nr:endo-1,4-beta-xylanase [uncultured bacterium]
MFLEWLNAIIRHMKTKTIDLLFMIVRFRFGVAFASACCAVGTACAEFKVDRSVMSDAYWKIWNDQAQATIDADIEKFRKADASFEIAAPDGTEVTVEQKSHSFFFGAHIFNFNQLGKKEWNDRYKELYGTLFNSATVAFYWRTLEMYPYAPRFEERYEDTENFWNNCPHPKDQPHWRRPAPDSVISFLRTRGVRIHGHPLVWGNNAWHTPTWLWDDFCPESEKVALQRAAGVAILSRDVTQPICTKDMKNDPGERRWAGAWKKIYERLSEDEIAALVPTYIKALDSFYERRIREIGERYGSRVDSWDVVNESATDFDCFGRKAVRGKAFDKSHYGPMPADYAYKAFMWSQKYLSKSAWLNINEYNMEPFFEQAKDLIANGARIDVIGSQMHLFNPAESVNIARGEGPAHLRPEGIKKRFSTLAQADRPIHLSEITITAPDNSSRGQMVQAIITRNLYRAWFAVEKMNGITWWNVVDDCATVGEPSISGIFTRDMRPKAAYHALNDLIHREWKTKTTVKAQGGKVSFRGFRGCYHLTWKNADGSSGYKSVNLK